MKKPVRATREEWSQRVDRWMNSNQSAREFASEIGANEKTLVHWAWRLRGSSARRGVARTTMRSATRAPRRVVATTLPFVELPPGGAVVEATYEIVLAGGRRIRVPASFRPEALKTLIAAVESV